MFGIAERDLPQMMFTEVGCDRKNSQSQESTAHQSMSTLFIDIRYIKSKSVPLCE